MIDCGADVKAFHDQKVTLPESERDKMRERRNTNRDRLKRNLEKDEKPTPYEHVSQGSYRMRTMLQDDNNDYDIDDGAYFQKGVLVGDRGAEMSSLDARKMVRKAMDDGSFKTPPEVKGNCVRVHYSEGYHVDIPVYRRIVDEEADETYYELASSSGWKRSDARDVTNWYEETREGTSDARQFRRLNRYLKKHARSRESWKSRNLSGFAITVLLAETYVLSPDRDDIALYRTMEAMKSRLDGNTVIDHPVTPNETVTTDDPDAKARFFRDKLKEALDHLAPVYAHDCDRESALKYWDKVFDTTFFSERYEDEKAKSASLSAPAIGSAAILGSTAEAAASVSARGGGRHA
ncbi:MAG: hypothetical protein OXF79_17465 [Chloroflexi bacterium]|nr:hypothetical protein [Chloroflexota bacterium]